VSESALMRAVRDQIRAHASYENHHCNVEIDERAPSVAPDLYIIVTYGGVAAGPIHFDSDGDDDTIFGVNVSIAIRSPRKPRDRQRDFWIDLTKSFEVHFRNIQSKVDKQIAVITAANAYITAEEPAGQQGFGIPLKFSALGPIREAPAEIFAGFPGEPAAALIRTIEYRGARRNEIR